jgi:adenylate cyclase
MTPRRLGLETLTSCFQGIIPAMFYTCAKDGTPNAAYLSHIDYVDSSHVALSFQFFNKSRRNVAENPQALVQMIDPDTQQGWHLRLKYVRSETTGAIFDRMALRIEAIASYTGLKGIFKLHAADIYEVVTVTPVAGERGHDAEIAAPGRRAVPVSVFTMGAFQDLAQRINAAPTLEELLESILAGLEEFFGFGHSMLLLAAEEPGVLVTLATRGYDGHGVGAEARFGEGIAGVVAEAQKPIRISGLLRGMLYAYAVAKRAEAGGWCPGESRIVMPGMQNPASQLGVPLVVRGELIGVLVIESASPYRFHEEDKTTIELLGSYLAIAIQNMQLQESAEAAADSGHTAGSPGVKAEQHSPAPDAAPAVAELTFHKSDEVILADGEYLIRGLPAKILWKVLSLAKAEGRREFTNRELRLDKSLGLPDFKDNLETRLLLLRRRLDQKNPGLRIVPAGRGRFALEATSQLSLVERP